MAEGDTMKSCRISWFAGASLAVCLFGVASAGPFEDGVVAQQHGDYVTAMRLWRPLADAGSPIAQYDVGMLYAYGLGVPRDLTASAAWYRRAAESGVAEAQANLGAAYANGWGV